MWYDLFFDQNSQKKRRVGGRDWESARPQAEFFCRRPPEQPKKTSAIRPGGPTAEVALRTSGSLVTTLHGRKGKWVLSDYASRDPTFIGNGPFFKTVCHIWKMDVHVKLCGMWGSITSYIHGKLCTGNGLGEYTFPLTNSWYWKSTHTYFHENSPFFYWKLLRWCLLMVHTRKLQSWAI